jgi:hypothetical protein
MNDSDLGGRVRLDRMRCDLHAVRPAHTPSGGFD